MSENVEKTPPAAFSEDKVQRMISDALAKKDAEAKAAADQLAAKYAADLEAQKVALQGNFQAELAKRDELAKFTERVMQPDDKGRVLNVAALRDAGLDVVTAALAGSKAQFADKEQSLTGILHNLLRVAASVKTGETVAKHGDQAPTVAKIANFSDYHAAVAKSYMAKIKESTGEDIDFHQAQKATYGEALRSYQGEVH